MVKKDKFLYPATPESVHKYAGSIFTPIRKGECVTTIWVPMAGRRMWNKFIIENINLFEKELPNFDKYILVYVEPLDLTEESLSGYMRLMGASFIDACKKNVNISSSDCENYLKVFNDESSSYTKLYESFKEIIENVTDDGFTTIFFLGEFDELSFTTPIFFNNLKSIWGRFYPRLYFVFLSAEDLSRPDMGDRYKELNAAILQNVIYVPLRNDKDVDYVISFFEERFNCKLGKEKKNFVKEYCGGHPFLIRVVLKNICNNLDTGIDELIDEITNNYEVISISRRIYSLRTVNEKEILTRIVKNKTVETSDALNRLIALGLVKKLDDNSIVVFGKLFENIVKKEIDKGVLTTKTENDDLYLDKDNIVCFKGVSVEEKFTNQEYRIIRYLLSESGKLKTREQIAETIWGDESYERYSDWAIDQLISKTRKKLKDIGALSTIITVRGRGYKLSR